MKVPKLYPLTYLLPRLEFHAIIVLDLFALAFRNQSSSEQSQHAQNRVEGQHGDFVERLLNSTSYPTLYPGRKR